MKSLIGHFLILLFWIVAFVWAARMCKRDTGSY